MTQSEYYVSDGQGSVLLEAGIKTPRSGQVLLKTLYAGINRGDVLGLTGAYGEPTPKGRWVGQDIVGTVAAVGPGVDPDLKGRIMFGQISGAWGQHAIADSSSLAGVGSLDPQHAATLPLAGFTALRLVREAEKALGELRDRKILVTGGTGAVGGMLVELLVHRRAEVWVLTRRPMVQGHDGVNYVESLEDVPDVDAAFESLGPALEEVLRHLVPGGHVWWFGQATRQAPGINFFDYLGRSPWNLHHFAHGAVEGSDVADLAELSSLAQEGRITVPTHHLIHPSELPSAIDQIVNDRMHSKAILDYTRLEAA